MPTKQSRIEVHPKLRGGQPCVRGTRISVRDIMERLEGGWSVEELLDSYPSLKRADIEAAQAYADEQPGRLGAAG